MLLCPAAATTAFPLDEAGEPWQRTLPVNGQPMPLTTQLFWAGHSGLCGLPSTVAPIGPRGTACRAACRSWRGAGAISPLRFAQLLEAAGYGYQPPRGLASAGIDR